MAMAVQQKPQTNAGALRSKLFGGSIATCAPTTDALKQTTGAPRRPLDPWLFLYLGTSSTNHPLNALICCLLQIAS